MKNNLYLKYCLIGFSLSQLLGTLIHFGFYQGIFVIFLMIFGALAIGFFKFSEHQKATPTALSKTHLLAFETPSLIFSAIVILGFIIGVVCAM